MGSLHFEDDSDQLQRPPDERESRKRPHNEASLILTRLQQALRLLSGDLNQDRLRKLLSNMGTDASALGKLFSEKGLPLSSKMCDAVGKLAKELSQEAKTVDASIIRTFSHALDCLRGYNTAKVSRAHSQRLPIDVLVLDDDAVCRKVMQLALRAEHMNVVLCESAENALNCVEAFPFDVVLSDILMPEMDGFEFVKRLRGVEVHANTPVIFITALNDLLTRSRSRLTGGCEFISKPINPAELVVKVLGFAWKSRLAQGPEEAETAPEVMPATQLKASTQSPEVRDTPSRPMGVISIGSDGLVRSVNRDGASVLGCPAEELAGAESARLFAETAASGQANDLTADRLATLAAASRPIEVLARLKSGAKDLPLQMRVSRSGSGASAIFVCLFTATPAEQSGGDGTKAR